MSNDHALMNPRDALYSTLLSYSCESRLIRTIAGEATFEFLIQNHFPDLLTEANTLMSAWRRMPNSEMRLLEEIQTTDNMTGFCGEIFYTTMRAVMENLREDYADGTVTDIVLAHRSFLDDMRVVCLTMLVSSYEIKHVWPAKLPR